MQSVLRSLTVLETVAEQQPIGVNELARLLALPTSTVQRILLTLKDAGWLAPTTTGPTRWVITPRALAVGRASLSSQGLTQAASGPIRALRDEVDETVFLTIRDGDRMIIVDSAESEQSVRTYHPFGQSSPIHASASGRALLAALPDAEIDAVLGRDLVPSTDRTVTDPARLRQLLAEIRDAGYAVNRGENRPGVCAVAAAVLDPVTRGPLASVAVSLPEMRFDEETAARIGPRVTAAAVAISARI